MSFNVTTERLRGRELKCENMLTFGAYLFTTSVSKLSAMPLLLKARLEYTLQLHSLLRVRDCFYAYSHSIHYHSLVLSSYSTCR